MRPPLRKVSILTIITLFVTLLAGSVVRPTAGQAAAGVPGVIFYDAANFGGQFTVTSTSQTNLADISFDARAASLRVTGGITAAVYTAYGTAYGGGTCLTVQGDLPTLPATFDHAIKSIKLNWSCTAGPVQPPASVAWARLIDADDNDSTLFVTADEPNLGIYDYFGNVADRVVASPLAPVALYSQFEGVAGGLCLTVEPGTMVNLATSPLGPNSVVSLKLGARCTSLTTGQPGVLLYDGLNFTGEVRNVVAPTEDLRFISFDNRASSLKLVNGLKVAAVYYNSAFIADNSLLCETFVADDNDLRDNRVGDNTVSAVRPGYTCTGERVTGEPVITDMKLAIFRHSAVITCNTDTDFGWELRPQDLNESLGGAPIYLCVKYGTKGAPGSYYTGFRTHLLPVNNSEVAAICQDRGLLGNADWRTLTDADDFFANENLNYGVTSTYRALDVAFCVSHQVSNAYTPGLPAVASTKALKDVRFVATPNTKESETPSAADLQARCMTMFGGTTVSVDTGDVNWGQAPETPHTIIQTCTVWEGAGGGGVVAPPPTGTPVPPPPSVHAGGAPVTAVWRDAAATHLDLFATSRDGTALTTFWEMGKGWQPWVAIHPEMKVQAGAPVTAVWRDATHLDLFTTGMTGTVVTTFWEATQGWQPWVAVRPENQLAAGAQVSAVWRGLHLDLFGTRTDGTVVSTWWEVGKGWQPWFAIRPETKVQGGASVTAVWRDAAATHLDLFATRSDGTVVTTFWEAARGWQAFSTVRAETRLAPGAPVTAVWRDATHLDLFATGMDGMVLSTYKDGSADWPAWFSIHPETRLMSGARVAALWGGARIHLFGTRADGTTVMTWWEGGQGWQAWSPLER